MLELQISLVRAEERRARRKLEQGCAQDLAALESLIEKLSSASRDEWGKSLGAISDSANIRFRARFRVYAEAVRESESLHIATPRRIALPRLRLEHATMPICRQKLREILEREVEFARQRLVRRVVASIARSRARQMLRS